MYLANFTVNQPSVEVNLEMIQNSATANLILNVTPDRTSMLINDSRYITKDVNDLSNYMLTTDISDALNGKVDKVVGKGLSTNDFSDNYRNKINNLATVATSGNYNDLSNKPTIPTKTSELINDSGFITSSALNGYATEAWVGNQGYITGINSSDIKNALGYTPYDSSNPNGYTSNVGTVTSVNNTQPVNGNVTISIPSEVTETTVANWGFTKNLGTVTSVNNVSPTNGNVSITIPTDTSDLTNGAGYITSSALSGYLTTADIVSSVSSSSTNSKAVGAKLFYDTCGNIETALQTIRGV